MQHDAACACKLRIGELLAFRATLTRFQVEDKIEPTVEKNYNCDHSKNSVHVYESLHSVLDNNDATPNRSQMTRRLVLNQLYSDDRRHCMSFWLPLSDIRFSISDVTVKLQWSDCNQPKPANVGNYSKIWHWEYDPEHLNNKLLITFENSIIASEFVNIVRLPHQSSQTLQVSKVQELQVFDIDESVTMFRRAVVSTDLGRFATKVKNFHYERQDRPAHRILKG